MDTLQTYVPAVLRRHIAKDGIGYILDILKQVRGKENAFEFYKQEPNQLAILLNGLPAHLRPTEIPYAIRHSEIKTIGVALTSVDVFMDLLNERIFVFDSKEEDVSFYLHRYETGAKIKLRLSDKIWKLANKRNK